MIYELFDSALRGQTGRVVQIPHPMITFLAQNDNGRAALVAKLVLPPGQVVPDGRGFFVTTDRSGPDQFVRIVSSEGGLSLIFLKLVDYVLERTAGAKDDPDAARLLVLALDEFKRFGQRRSGRLTDEEIRGLVAELLFLLHLHEGDESRTWDVFHSWGGPFGALHDFTFAEGNAVEVKSTHRPSSEIRIASPAQLDPLPDGLDLVVLPLERVSNRSYADVSFVELVERVGVLARSHGGDVADLWEAVHEALGLDPSDEYYQHWHFAAGAWVRYDVTDGFPRIREADVPAAVVKVSFTLRLELLGDFVADFAKLEGLP